MNSSSSKDEKEKISCTFEEWKESKPLELSNKDIIYINSVINKGQKNEIKINTYQRDRFKLKSESRVGVVSLPSGITLYIKPKVPTENFLQILSYVWEISDWKTYEEEVDLESGRFLPEIIAKMFLYEAKDIFNKGLVKSYVSKIDNLSTIRGRILFHEEFKGSNFSKVEKSCEYDDLTHDIIENRTILYCSYLLRALVRDQRTKSELNNIINNLRSHGVEIKKIEPEEVEKITMTRLNDYYKSILDLSRLILNYIWIEKLWSTGEPPRFSLLIDMEKLFEDLIEKLLSKSMKDYQIVSQRSINNIFSLLNWGSNFKKPQSIPDNQIKKDGEKIAFIDAKYKKIPKIKNRDLWQASSYSLANDIPTILVYPEYKNDLKGGYEIVGGKESNKIFAITINLNKEIYEELEFVKDELKRKIEEIFKLSGIEK